MASPSRFRWGIRSFVGVLLGALFAAFALERADRNEHAPANVVMTYVKARRADDASNACKQLSGAQRREVVARVSRTPPAQSSPRDCERYVLVPSRRSELARPALATFRIAGATSERFTADISLVRPSGFSEPVVEVVKRDGQWRIDTRASERSRFVSSCKHEGVTASQCECRFDTARAIDPRVLDDTTKVTGLIAKGESGGRKGLVRKLNRRCTAAD